MGEIVKINELFINRIVKKVLNEIKVININPFTLEIINGDIKIINNSTKENRIYKIYKDGGFGPDLYLRVDDFPENGEKMKVTAVTFNVEKTSPLDKENIKNLLSKEWNKNEDEIEYTTKDGVDLLFKKKK